MSRVEIQTRRLLLKAVEDTDLEDFNNFLGDPEAIKYEVISVHTTIRQTKRFIDRIIAGPYNGIQDFSISLQDSIASPQNIVNSESGSQNDEQNHPTVIGYAGIRDDNEIGFIFNRNYWGKGYATEALNAILTCFWGERRNRRAVVKADVDPRNEASLHILKKLGFVVVGTAKKTFYTHIGWCDSVYLEAHRKSRGTWKTLTFEIPNALLINNRETYDDAVKRRGTSRAATDGPPPDIHNGKLFLVKFQISLFDFKEKAHMVIYDRQRSFNGLWRRCRERDLFDEAELSMGNELRMYRWAKRVGDYQLSVCFDRTPSKNPPW